MFFHVLLLSVFGRIILGVFLEIGSMKGRSFFILCFFRDSFRGYICFCGLIFFYWFWLNRKIIRKEKKKLVGDTCRRVKASV